MAVGIGPVSEGTPEPEPLDVPPPPPPQDQQNKQMTSAKMKLRFIDFSGKLLFRCFSTGESIEIPKMNVKDKLAIF